ncbi:putative dinucleotide-binding enzyme [Bradyrhizobium japonicum]
MAIAFGHIPALRDALTNSLSYGAILIDVGNYYPDRDGHIAELDQGVAESAWVSNQFGRPVIKALNNIMADQLPVVTKAKGVPGRADSIGRRNTP